MKRHSIEPGAPYGDGDYYQVVEDVDGEWVRYEEANAEIARLRYALKIIGAGNGRPVERFARGILAGEPVDEALKSRKTAKYAGGIFASIGFIPAGK
jgi:hypothetical protein